MAYKVYQIKNKRNRRIYIGATEKLLQIRLKAHIGCARHNPITPFYQDIIKYGEAVFYIDLLEICQTKEEMLRKERNWIEAMLSEGYLLYNKRYAKPVSDIYIKIKKHMDENGIMQKWLCDKTGISATHVYNFINGHRGISEDKLKKIASALKLS